MLIDFFYQVKEAKIPVSTKEFLTLLEALDKRIVSGSIDDFYHLARLCLIKDEKYFDKFDQVFGRYFHGIESLVEQISADIPEEWLRKQLEKHLTEEEKAKLKEMSWDELMETLKKRLAEQKKRHQGGSKWIGTGGTSPFGAYGYNPMGIRIGGEEGSGQRRAVKVWDQREYQNFDDSIQLGIRNIKVALRRLRRFAREGMPEMLDLDDTIKSTARNAGYLDLKMVPELRNKVKVLLFLDVGGSMDEHTRQCEELFSAAKSEFKHLEYFYFHNFVYDYVWKDNRRRYTQRIPTWDVLHKYGRDYKLVFVGDASMSPYEIHYYGGSVEQYNLEPGVTWFERLLDAYPSNIWWNPLEARHWRHADSVQMINQMIGERMYPLTIAGLEQGIRQLRRP